MNRKKPLKSAQIGLVFTVGILIQTLDLNAQKIEIFKNPEVHVSYSMVARESYVSDTYWKRTGANSFESCLPKKWEYTFTVDILNLTPYYKKLRLEVVPEMECYLRNERDFDDGIEVIIEPNQSKLFKHLKVSSEEDVVPTLKVNNYSKKEFDYSETQDLIKNGGKVSQFDIIDLKSFSTYELVLGGFNPHTKEDSYIKTIPPSIAKANQELTMDLESDTLLSQLKRDGNGIVVKYEFEMGNKTYKESFDIKKGWQVHYVSNLDTLSHSGTSTYLEYNSLGYLFWKQYFIYNGEHLDQTNSKDFSFSYEYYPSGQLKLAMEMKLAKNGKKSKTWAPWNIIEYRYPDGSSFLDYGNLKNGSGTYKILTDDGKICESCSSKSNFR